MPPPAPRRRGRPETSDQERAAMRERIEAAAGALFRAEGFAAVSMRRIASEIGCAPMTLYSYFENKIDILRALWAQVFTELFDDLARLVPTDASPRARLAALGAGYVAFWIAHPEKYRMVFMADGVSQPDVSAFIENPAIASRFSLLFDAVAAAQADGASADDIREKCDLLLVVLHGAAHCAITMSGYPWTSAERLIDRALIAVTA